jgi:hypothetical protein
MSRQRGPYEPIVATATQEGAPIVRPTAGSATTAASIRHSHPAVMALRGSTFHTCDPS